MSLRDELEKYVRNTFLSRWTERAGNVVPDPEDLTLDNTGVHLDRATVLYADLAGSTRMVDGYNWQFAGEIYKNYLYCASRLIRNEGGVITAYDGDRVMAVFIGDYQSSSVHASRTGVRGDNDLVWIGRAPNYAAKLTELSQLGPTWITEDVFHRLSDEAKYSNGRLMWEKRSWTQMAKHTVYLATWQWSIE
jgi:class 3 adenylate cyclase